MLQPRRPDTPPLVNVLSTPKRIRCWFGDRLVADNPQVLPAGVLCPRSRR